MNISNIIYTMKRVGIGKCFVGILRRPKLTRLCRKFNVPMWHGNNPVEFREYAMEVIRIIKGDSKRYPSSKGYVVEVGCGIGDMLNRIPAQYDRVGYDIDHNALRLGRHIYPQIVFKEGSFDKIEESKIEFLIMVNMSFGITPDAMKEYMRSLLDRAVIRNVILETYSNNSGTEYKYSHDGTSMLGEKYKLDYKSNGMQASHGAIRYIERWKLI